MSYLKGPGASIPAENLNLDESRAINTIHIYMYICIIYIYIDLNVLSQSGLNSSLLKHSQRHYI